MTIRNFETHSSKIHETTYIDDTALVSGQVEIAEELSGLRGGMNYIKIGKRTYIQDGSVLHITHAPK